MCTPEDDFKGVHAMNPIAVNPEKHKTRPFAAMPFTDIQLGTWRFREMQRRQGNSAAVSPLEEIDLYFIAHPEQAELALAGDPRFKFRMPPVDLTGFRLRGQNCMEGKFKLNIRPEANSQ